MSEVIAGILKFSLTDEQKASIARVIENAARDIAADQRELLAREYEEAALNAKDTDTRRFYSFAAMNLRRKDPPNDVVRK